MFKGFRIFYLISLFFVAISASAADAMAPPKKDVPPTYPTIDYGKDPKQAEILKRGEYLVKAGDCIACHTNKDGGKTFAGGLPIITPFGTIFTSNITPDKETGIGNWTDAQFLKAFKQGIRPNGSYLFPAFPYVYYNRLSDDDALAIFAYLKAIPAIHQENQPPYMPIPFRWRFLQIFWRFLFFDFQKGDFKPDPNQTAEWNRGKYLVEGLGHCGMCHTPLNFLGAEKKSYFLSGGFVQGFYAPNITSSNLGNVPMQQVLDVFLKDKLIGGGNVQGPMLEANRDSFKYLKQDDLENIVTYLKTVRSKQPPKAKTSTKIDIKVGEKIYNQYCQGCHATGAGGAPKLGDAAAWGPRIQLGIEALYKNAINGIGGMPPKGNCSSCSDTDIQSAVLYLVSQSKGAPGEAAAAPAQPAEDPTSLAKGQQIYNQVCSTCHDKGQLGAPQIGNKTEWTPLIKKNMDVLFLHAIHGYKGHPAKGSCYECSDADIIAAVKYMVQQSKTEGDYDQW